ncbi:MAG: class I SAM-dependent methyltransferase [Anaerolineae bacterium]
MSDRPAPTLPSRGSATSPELPSRQQLEEQAEWLAPARAQTLRRVQIARRRAILELGAGYGAVTPELVRRAGGRVTALDRSWGALQRGRDAFAGAARVTADAVRLPFADQSFDLVFCQLTLLWVSPLSAAIEEVERVLTPQGVFVALEPDYGGMIEYPDRVATRQMWIEGLERAEADPYVGRKLPGLLADQGFSVRVSLFNTLEEPDPARFELLRGLPLTDEEMVRLSQIEEITREMNTPWSQVAHLPFVIVRATKREKD